MPAFSDRPTPLAICTILAAVENVEAATGATVVPRLLFSRWSTTAHGLRALPLLGCVGRPTPSAVITAVANSFLATFTLLFAVLIAVGGPLLW